MKFKYKKLIFTATASIMLLGMVIFTTKPDTKGVAVTRILTNSGSASGSSIAEAESANTASETASDIAESGSLAGNTSAVSSDAAIESEASPVAVTQGLLLKDAYPEVNLLITNYFNALADADIDTLKGLVDDIEYFDTDSIKQKAEDIEGYSNISCYTFDGPENGSYMVYAYNEVKFKDIDTAASALDGFYVKKDAGGELKIVGAPLDDSIQAIINEDTKRDDVQALLSDVNTRLAKELKSDEALKKLYDSMGENNGTDSNK